MGRDEAKAAGATVLMGYNKNVCKYVSKARDYAAANEGSHVTFVSNNAYANTPESLGECFERNREGMLKNMAIHELALLVSFYDVSVDAIDKCEADKEFSSCQTLKGPSGDDFTDFDKIKLPLRPKVENPSASKLTDAVVRRRTPPFLILAGRRCFDIPCRMMKTRPT